MTAGVPVLQGAYQGLRADACIDRAKHLHSPVFVHSLPQLKIKSPELLQSNSLTLTTLFLQFTICSTMVTYWVDARLNSGGCLTFWRNVGMLIALSCGKRVSPTSLTDEQAASGYTREGAGPISQCFYPAKCSFLQFHLLFMCNTLKQSWAWLRDTPESCSLLWNNSKNQSVSFMYFLAYFFVSFCNFRHSESMFGTFFLLSHPSFSKKCRDTQESLFLTTVYGAFLNIQITSKTCGQTRRSRNASFLKLYFACYHQVSTRLDALPLQNTSWNLGFIHRLRPVSETCRYYSEVCRSLQLGGHLSITPSWYPPCEADNQQATLDILRCFPLTSKMGVCLPISRKETIILKFEKLSREVIGWESKH